MIMFKSNSSAVGVKYLDTGKFDFGIKWKLDIGP